MKIKFADIRNELLSNCILHTISRDNAIGDRFIEDTHKNKGVMNLKLTAKIEGDVSIELPLEKWFEKLDGELERWVKEKAKELIDEKLFDIEDEFTVIMQDVRERMGKINVL